MYRDDRDRWKETFSGKVVEMTGTVVDYKSREPLFDSGIFVLLDGEEFDEVNVELSEDRPWLRHAPGSTLTAIGEVGYSADTLKDAVVTSAEPGPELPSYTAAEMFAADPDSLNVPGRFVSVTGTLTHFAEDFGESGLLYLGDGDTDLVKLQAREYEFLRAKNLQPGDEVVVIGRGMRYEGELPEVFGAFVMKPLPPLPDPPEMYVRRDRYDRDVPHLVFSAEQLAEWIDLDPRAFESSIKSDTPFGYPGSITTTPIEVSGEIESVSPGAEGDEAHVYVRLKNDSGVDIRFAVEKDDEVLARLEPGDAVTVRGRFEFYDYSDRHAYVNDCQVISE
jgi:hypothetical protein